MKTIFLVFQIVISIGLIGSILIQSGKGGLGTSFGGGGEFRSRRGAEKLVFRFTIILAVLFFAVSLVNLLVH